MGLKSTGVSRCLEKKLLLFGFELPDLLVIFFFLSVLNLILGSAGHDCLLIWLPATSLALGVRLAKAGKPDNYLIHLIRFKTRSHVLQAFPEPSIKVPPPKFAKK